MSTVDDERTSASSSSRGRTGTRGKKFVNAIPSLSFNGTLSFVGLKLAKDSCLFVKKNSDKPFLIISVLVDDLQRRAPRFERVSTSAYVPN